MLKIEFALIGYDFKQVKLHLFMIELIEGGYIQFILAASNIVVAAINCQLLYLIVNPASVTN